MHKRSVYVVTLAVLAAGLFGLSYWLSVYPGAAIRDAKSDYCEKSRYLRNLTNASWPNTTLAERAEPVNAITSLCFIITPTLLATLYYKKLNALVFVAGIYQIIHVLGTLANHLCGCQPGFVWDNASQWSLLAYLISVNLMTILTRARCVRDRAEKCVVVVIPNLITTPVFTLLSFLRMTAVAQNLIQGGLFITLVALGSATVAMRIVSRRASYMFMAAVILLTVGVVFAALDTAVCLTPRFGFHALWHVFGGALAMPAYVVYILKA